MGIAISHTLAPQFRWTSAENLHVTIRFLGHLDQEVAQGIATRVEGGAPKAFAIQLGALDSFKRGRLARVLWLGVSVGAEEVAALAGQVDEESVRAGLQSENRAYRPHVTLARSRLREGVAIPQMSLPELPPWRADELVLYRSILGRSGPVYEPLRKIRLR